MLPGVTLPAVPEPDPGQYRDQYGKFPTTDHIFHDDRYFTLYTAEEVINAVENRAHCRVDPLALILFRKGIITGDEFLEAVHARDFHFGRD